MRTDLCGGIGYLEAHRCIPRRYVDARHGLNSTWWGSLVHQQMDKLPDHRIIYFRDLVPDMLMCTLYTQMKPFVIETLLGLAHSVEI